MKKNRLLATLMAGTVMASSLLSACGGGTSSPAPAAEGGSTAAPEAASSDVSDSNAGEGAAEGVMGEAVSLANQDPISFMPLRQTGGNGKNSLNEIYESLMDQDGFGGELYGNLAKDWYFDGTDLHVEIFDYIYDSAGNHITAEDVVYSYEASWAAGYTTSKYLSYTTGAEAAGDYEVVFHWKEEEMDTYNALENLLMGQYIFSQSAFEASEDQMATSPVGTGPYKLKEFVPGSYAVLEARDDYWQTDESLIGPQHRANVKTITYKFITDSSQVVNALKSGDIDYADAIDEAAVATFKNSGDWTVVNKYDNKLFCMYYNCLEGTPFHDINLRAALCYAVNSDDVLAAVGGEEFARKVYEYGIPGCISYNEDCETWSNYYTITDLDLAKDYLSKSGYSNETIKIYYYVSEYSSYMEAISLCVSAACEQLGMKYEMHPFNQLEEVVASTNGDWDILITTVGGDGNAVDYIQHNFNNERYEGGLANNYDPELDALFAKTCTASGATVENVSEFNQYLIDQYYVYGFFSLVTSTVMRADLIADCSVMTKRCWSIPGSWVYKR